MIQRKLNQFKQSEPFEHSNWIDFNLKVQFSNKINYLCPRFLCGWQPIISEIDLILAVRIEDDAQDENSVLTIIQERETEITKINVDSIFITLHTCTHLHTGFPINMLSKNYLSRSGVPSSWSTGSYWAKVHRKLGCASCVHAKLCFCKQWVSAHTKLCLHK